MTVLSVDSGKNVGWCLWTEEGMEIDRGVCDMEDFPVFLEDIDDELSIIIYEDYIGFKNQSHNGRQTGSRFVASQVIGMLKQFAKPRGVKLVRQQSNILSVSAAHTGYKLPKGHLPDQDSAYLHGHYYFVVQGILKAQVIW